MTVAGFADRIELMRTYASPFLEHRPPIFDFFPNGKRALFPFEVRSDRGLAILLLCASLYRPGGEMRAGEIIGGLFSRIGPDIFKVNRLPFPDLQSALDDLVRWPDGEEKKRAPGILRSVCDFFTQSGGLGKWLTDSQDWEDRVHCLSQKIFWMGKQSRLHTKARYFLWLCSFQSGFGSLYPAAKKFSWPIESGHSRFLRNILRPQRSRTSSIDWFSTPDAKLHWFRKLAEMVFPDEPWRLFAPLRAYLQPVSDSIFVCRDIYVDCKNCPLGSICPESKIHTNALNKQNPIRLV